MPRIFVILFLSVSLSSLQTLKCQTNWELTKEKSGIEVYLKQEENQDYKSFKAITEVNASMHSLLAVFKDVERMSLWMANCESAELLEQNGFWEQVGYFELGVPLLRNRDMVVKMTIQPENQKGQVRIDLKNLPDYLPNEKRKVRIPRLQGYWLCTPLDNDRTQIEYVLYIDPGKGIPSWLHNKRLTNDPYNTLVKLKDILEKPQFQNAYFKELELVAAQENDN